MMKTGFGFRSSMGTALVLGAMMATGCPSDLDETGDGTEGADSTGAPATTTEGMTGPVATTGNSDTTSPGADTTAGADGMDEAGFITAGSTDDGSMPLPNGGQCGSNDSCESGFCYQIPMLGGVCSECLMDSDCDMGTCQLDVGLLYAVCGEGTIGAMCDSDEGCTEGTCELVIDTGGLFDITTCSECGPDVACGDPMQICTPVYDLASISGYLGCVDPMSVPDGGGCPWEGGVGDGTPCASGICAPADVFGVITLGVCGECATDMDCMGMQTCQPAAADMTGIVPSMCV